MHRRAARTLSGNAPTDEANPIQRCCFIEVGTGEGFDHSKALTHLCRMKLTAANRRSAASLLRFSRFSLRRCYTILPVQERVWENCRKFYVLIRLLVRVGCGGLMIDLHRGEI
jgi:hypothetical protein